MSMIATGGPAAPPFADLLPNSAWWPDVSFAAYRAASRIDRTATDPQALVAITEALGSVNAQLAGWLGHQIALDPAITCLGDIPDPAHQAAGYYVGCYLRAVHGTADALLAERYRDFDSTADADRRADAMEGRIDAYRRDAQHAIADLTGVRRRTVELL